MAQRTSFSDTTLSHEAWTDFGITVIACLGKNGGIPSVRSDINEIDVTPKLTDLKETALYVDDLERAKRFYRSVMGLATLVEEDRFCALDVAGKHVLLLFIRGASTTPTQLPGGTIPPHDGAGALHAAFAVDTAELPAWEEQLKAHGIDILSRVSWPRGGKSVYFHDPDGNLLELLTPGVWPTY